MRLEKLFQKMTMKQLDGSLHKNFNSYFTININIRSKWFWTLNLDLKYPLISTLKVTFKACRRKQLHNITILW